MKQLLNSWTTPSSNRCDATLTVDHAGDSIAIRFTWASPPSAEDRDFHYEALAEAIGLADGALSERKALHDACLDLWAEGKIAPIETLDDGQRRWRTTSDYAWPSAHQSDSEPPTSE